MSRKTQYQVAAVLGVLLFCGAVSISGSGKEAVVQAQNEDKAWETPSICVNSPDGKYCAEAVGEESVGGWTYPELIQIKDQRSGQIVWSQTAFMNPAFLWSGDGTYLAVQSAGRKWTACTLLECDTWSELPAPNIQSVYEFAEDLPEPYENGSTAVIPLEWLSNNRLLLEVYWDAVEPSGSYRVEGTVEYKVDSQAYKNPDLHMVSAG